MKSIILALMAAALVTGCGQTGSHSGGTGSGSPGEKSGSSSGSSTQPGGSSQGGSSHQKEGAEIGRGGGNQSSPDTSGASSR